MTKHATTDLPRLTPEGAPPEARIVLDRAKQQVGMVPNMYGYMAHIPGLLETYLPCLGSGNHPRRIGGERPADSLQRRPEPASVSRDTTYRVVDGKLYLNVNKSVQRDWLKDVPGNIAKADAAWPALRTASSG